MLNFFGITRGLGGINLECNIYKNPNFVNLYLGSGLYLSTKGLANVSKFSMSYGVEDCIDLSLFLVAQLSDMSKNVTPEYCAYGTDNTRYGSSIGYRMINSDNRSFWLFQFSLQFSNKECYIAEPNITGTPRTQKYGIKPIHSVGITYGMYLYNNIQK